MRRLIAELSFGQITTLVVLYLTLLNTVQAQQPAKEQKSTGPVAAQVLESGTFRFYDSKQVQGEENYQVRQEGDHLLISSRLDLPFWGEEVRPSLTATLRLKRDLTPERFEIKGIEPTETEINTSVEIAGPTATVREGEHVERVTLPDRFFTLTGYAPAAMEMMLVRYWLTHGAKGGLRLLPGGGEALIERRGLDSVTVTGRQVTLERFSLGGVGWGRETLWLDSANKLVALVNAGGDVETNFSVIRDGYDSALPFFLKRTAEDAVARYTQLADQLSPARKGALVLLGATLIDGTGKPPLVDSAIVIEGDRIVATGTRSQVEIPAGATVVEAGGKYVLPGLWDMHSHLYQAELGPAYLAAGITTARDVGNEFEFVTALRDAARQGKGLLPRILLAGYINGKNDKHEFDVQVDTPAEARAAVRRYKDAGFEQIKIRDRVKPGILRVITTEAHRLGMTVTGHVPENMNALQAVEAGQDQINHINFVLPLFVREGAVAQQEGGPPPIDLESAKARKVLRFFKERGTVFDPTIATIELMIRPKNLAIETFEPGVSKVAPALVRQLNRKGLPAEAAPQVLEEMQQMLAVTGALHRAGIPIVAGTDVSVPGYSLYRELELYVKAGLTPMEAIQSATLTPARVMKLDGELGTVEVNKRADMIVLDANPLENISNIRRVNTVVAHGRLYKSALLWQSVDFKP